MIVSKVSTSPPSSFSFRQTVRLQFFTIAPGDMIHLPIHGGEADAGSPASSSGASPPATEPSWSPTKIRRIANAGLPRLPLPRRVKDLPPLDTVQVSHIVQRHAYQCMLSGKYGDPVAHRVRRRTKRPVSVVELLEHIALMPAKGVWRRSCRGSSAAGRGNSLLVCVCAIHVGYSPPGAAHVSGPVEHCASGCQDQCLCFDESNGASAARLSRGER